MSAITAKASRKMKKYAVLTREPRCFLGSFDFSWEQRKVGDLLIERNQQAPMSDEYPLMAFIANEGVAPKGERYDRSALVTDTVNKLYKKTEKGDFIYSSNNLEAGSIGLNKYGKACISPVYSIFEPTGIADSDFLGRRLVRKDFINAMVKWRQGVIYGQWRIHESDFLKIEITVPSVEEQRKIGAYLDQLDNLITLHQRKCVFLFGFFQAFISMIFTASTFSWEQRKVGDLLIERNQQAPMSDEYPLMAFIANEGVAPKGERYDRSALVTDTVNKLYKKTEKGDFIYSSNNLEAGSIGLNKYGKACISPVYSIFEPTGIADSDFLGRRLVRKDFINAMVKWRQGVIYGQWRIHESDFLKIEITVPSVEEQRKIGAYLDQLDNLITLHQRECISFTARAGRRILTANKKRNTSSWEQRKLGDIASDMVAGGDIDKDLILAEGQYPVIANALTGDGIVGYYDKEYRVNAPAVTVTGRGDVGHAKARLVNFTPVVRLLSVKSEHDVFFLENAINTLKIVIESTGVPQLTVPQLAKYEVAFPLQLDEEEHIGAFFKQLDHLITLHQRKPFLMKWRTSDANRNKTNRLVL